MANQIAHIHFGCSPNEPPVVSECLVLREGDAGLLAKGIRVACGQVWYHVDLRGVVVVLVETKLRCVSPVLQAEALKRKEKHKKIGEVLRYIKTV